MASQAKYQIYGSNGLLMKADYGAHRTSVNADHIHLRNSF